jgi:hypothetical protein
MKRTKLFVLALACGAVLSISAAGFAVTPPQNNNTNQNADSCCDMPGCCKDAAMSCCKARTRRGKNAHACCKGKDNSASCCCKGDSCPMPNKKAGNSNSN